MARAVPAYKEFLVTLSVIYPLTMAVPWLLRPMLHMLSGWPLVAHLADTAAVLGLMTWVVMPYYTRWLGGWLHRRLNPG